MPQYETNTVYDSSASYIKCKLFYDLEECMHICISVLNDYVTSFTKHIMYLEYCLLIEAFT